MPRVVVQATGRQAAHLGTDRRDTVIQAAGTSVIGSWGSRNKCNRFRGQQEQVQWVQGAEGTIAKGTGGRRNNCKGYRMQKEQLQRVQEAPESVATWTGCRSSGRQDDSHS